MTMINTNAPSRPLAFERDDDLDWSPERAREFGDEVLSLWTDYLERLPELDVSGSASAADVKAAVTRDIPDEPLSVPQLMDALHTLAFDHTTRVGHPGFMAYISGTGTVPGAVADMLAAGLNQNVGGWRLAPAATEIELHLGRWFAQRLSLPSPAGGYVTSGGAMAAFVVLLVVCVSCVGWFVLVFGLCVG